MHEKILQELEDFQLATEVLKSQDFSGRFCWLGVVASFAPLDGVFNYVGCSLKLDVGVDLPSRSYSPLRMVDKSTYASILIGTSNLSN
jgi:hypothetical protein